MKNRLNFSPIQQNFVSISILLLLALLFFWRVPLQGRVLLPLDVLYTYEPWRSEVPGALGVRIRNPWLSDAIRFYYPLLSFVQSSWQRGEIPFWSPYTLTGTPVLAAGINQVLYPITLLLLLLLPVAQAMSWSTIIHTFLGSLFCFLFIREMGAGHFGGLIGAISFMFGALVYWMPALPTFQAIIWLPFLFWALERSLKRQSWPWAVAGGLILCLQILAGNVQMAYYSVTGLGLYAFYRSLLNWRVERNVRAAWGPLAFFLILVASGLGLGAVQLLPTVELLPYGARAEVDFEPQFSWLILLRLLVPDILGTDLDYNLAPGFAHELYLYFGLLPLLFLIAAAFSPYRHLAGGLIGLGALVWLVIFKVPPFHQIFVYFYPTYQVLGFHRAQILIAFAWAAAAGLGADWLCTSRPEPLLKTIIRVGEALLVIIVIGVLGLAFLAKYQARFWWNLPSVEELKPQAIYLLSSLAFSSIILTAALVLMGQWRQGRINQRVFELGVILIVVADLFLAHIDYVSALEPDRLYPQTPSLTYLQNLAAKETQPFRLMSVGRLFWGNDATVFGLSDIQGYDPFLLKSYSDYINLTGARLETNHRIAAFAPRFSKFIDALNVKYYYAPRSKLTEGQWISLLRQLDKPLVESDQPYAGQMADWVIQGWPQPVLLTPTPSRVTYQGFLPSPTRLETAVAIDPAVWVQPQVEVLFEIYAQSNKEPAPKLLFSKRLTQTPPAELRWIPVAIDLSNFTNQEVQLSFVASAPGRRATTWNAGWADPLLVDSSKAELLYYGSNSIYLNKNYLPRAWVVHQATEVSAGDTQATLAALANPAFDPAAEAVVAGLLPGPLSGKIGNERAEITHYSPARSSVEAELSAPGLLLVSDMPYPGWNVYVDGSLNPLYTANLIMRAVYLPAGKHTVEFVYEPFSFKVGLLISAGTAILVVLALTLNWKFIRKNHAPANPESKI